MESTEREADRYARLMVEHQLRARGIVDGGVLDAMGRVPRHRFVPDAALADAYGDIALPTAEGQTISQPYMVAKMSELLGAEPGMKVLEVGTGSGYQTAVLSAMGAMVVTIEQSPLLARRAAKQLAEIGVTEGIEFVVGDGTLGYAAGAPYDRILVTAGAPHLPQAYREQLADDGRIVIPIGDREGQVLAVYQLTPAGWGVSESTPCRFVPLVGEDGW